MNSNRFRHALSKLLVAATAILIVTLLCTTDTSAATTEKVLYSFTGGTDGSEPHAGLIFDQSGNVYGTTAYGGLYGAGVAYRLSPNADGTWTQTVLHSFTGGSDGAYPDWDRLAIDTFGNLYGVTANGGIFGGGTLFKLSPNSEGTWTETVLHQFTWGRDGGQPRTTPIFDAAGNLYGTASYGGTYGCGTAFQLTPGSANKWTYRVIHQFRDKPACSPWSALIFDAAGSLYGTTRNQVGGCGSPPLECGTVFQLMPGPNNTWAYKVIHQFRSGNGGADPSVSGLVFDDAGILYGTTEHAGAYASGIFFKLTPGINNHWTFQVLHQFRESADGSYPQGQVSRDSADNLYGTAAAGGAYGGGTLFEMTPSPNGTRTFSVIYNFGGVDGYSPAGGAGVIMDAAGNLYGTTVVGGAYGYGVVYEITP